MNATEHTLNLEPSVLRNRIVSHFAQNLGSGGNAEVVFTRNIADSLDKLTGRIDTEIKIPTNVPAHPGISFNRMLPETLLRDATALIERCLRLRREHSELAARAFEALVQMDEYLQLDNIVQLEETYYDHPTRMDAKLMAAERFQKDTATTLKGKYEAEKGRVDREKGGIVGQVDDKSKLRTDHDLTSQSANLEAQALQASANINAYIERIGDTPQASAGSYYGLDSELKMKGAEHQRKRNVVARTVAGLRSLALTSPDGVLNFRAQMKPLEQQFGQDLAGAWQRLLAVRDGLKSIYGYDQQFPTSASGNIPFDELVHWVQGVNLWIAALLDQQQAFSFSVSLRKLMNSDDFKQARECGKWCFELPEQELPPRPLVRIRGVGLEVTTDSLLCGTPYHGSIWHAAISPPTQSRYVYPKNWLKSPGVRETIRRGIDQSHCGTIHLGSVQERHPSKQPVVVAPPRIQNLSPLGTWIIELSADLAEEVRNQRIEDVVLHLAIATL